MKTKLSKFVVGAVFASGLACVHAQDTNGTFDTAQSFTLNASPGNWSISPAGDLDFIRLEIPSSGVLTVQSLGDTDVYGRLYDASRALIASDDDSGTGLNFRIVRSVAQGTYYVRINHFSSLGTGNYQLQALFQADQVGSDDHGNTPGAATGLSLAGSPPEAAAAGSIESRGDNDFFSVDVPGAGELRIESSGSTDVYGYLYRGSTLLGADDDSGVDYNFRLSRRVTAGTHHVRVRHYSSSGTGNYGLRVVFIPEQASGDTNNSFATAQFLDVSGGNASANAAIELRGDNDYFVVNAPTGGMLTVSSTGNTDTYGYLYGSDQRLIAYNDDSAGTLNFSIRREVGAGFHFIRVRHYSSIGTGPYGLSVTFQSSGPVIGAPSTPAPGTGTRRAVVVGISDYQHINDLQLCDDDARAIRDMLQSDGWTVTILQDSQGTKSGIISAIQAAVNGATDFVFAFSGHGTRYGSTGYLCTYDGQDASGFLSESELAGALGAGGANVRIGVFLDSCHAGEFISRQIGAPVNRFFHPVDSQDPSSARNGAAATYLRRGLQRNGWTVLAGCRGSEYCYELPSLGHGWLSHRVITFLPQRATDTSRNGYSAVEELFRRIAGGYAGRQHPQLFDGDTTRHFDVTAATR
jgi:hypothetical protein